MTEFKSLFSFKKKEIQEVLETSKTVASIPGIKLLKSSKTPLEGLGKLLIVTPKSSGLAHERNLLRRRLKAIFYQEQLYEIPAIWIVIAGKGANKLTFEKLKQFLIRSIGAFAR